MIPVNKILIGLDSKGELSTLPTDEPEEDMYLMSAPGKCCPDASCDYSYHLRNKRTTCSICGTSCIDCKYRQAEKKCS